MIVLLIFFSLIVKFLRMTIVGDICHATSAGWTFLKSFKLLGILYLQQNIAFSLFSLETFFKQKPLVKHESFRGIPMFSIQEWWKKRKALFGSLHFRVLCFVTLSL